MAHGSAANVGAFYRIHTTRSLLLPPAHSTHVCATARSDTDQIGCLVTASPCSLGYAGREAVTNNVGVTSALVKALFLGGTV